MKMIWSRVNVLKIRKEVKNYLYISLSILINLLIGALVWLLIGRFMLPGMGWFLCFMGYLAIFVGLFGGILYLYKHEFV